MPYRVTTTPSAAVLWSQVHAIALQCTCNGKYNKRGGDAGGCECCQGACAAFCWVCCGLKPQQMCVQVAVSEASIAWCTMCACK